MYFAILGKHPKLSLAELVLVKPEALEQRGQTVFFESTLEKEALYSLLSRLGGVTKRGETMDNGQWTIDDKKILRDFLGDAQLLGVTTIELGMIFKKEFGVKRFKLVDKQSSDLEVKKEGKEIVELGRELGLVHGWQDIKRFELIDMEKPSRGMQIGMMPAKLAQLLVNIGVAHIQNTQKVQKNSDISLSDLSESSGTFGMYTVYDPFCGFGTTGFVANSLGYHFIGSDINITPAKINQKRRFETSTAERAKHFTLFKHDVIEAFDHPLLKQVGVIVTEGRLGPIVKKATRLPELQDHAEKIISLYTAFLNNISLACPGVPIVMTVPNYPRLPGLILTQIIKAVQSSSSGLRTVEHIDTYSRAGQEVVREVIVLR